MSKSKTVLIMAVALALGTGSAVFARGGGGGGVGGSPTPHMSSSAMTNSNGRFATDRDFGLDRAKDRMSKEGLAHEKASNHVRTPTRGKTSKADADDGATKK